MADQRTRFNWNQIASNAVSTLVAAVFVGAALVVWNAASTMDDKIEEANGGLKNTQISLKGTQEILKKEVADLQAKVEILESQLAKLEGGRKTSEGTPPKNTAAKLSVSEDLYKKLNEGNVNRIQQQLDVYQVK